MAVPGVKEKTDYKKQLRQSCVSVLEKRIAAAHEAMMQAQDSANAEEKSSAGDKYETSRAMGQLSRDMNARQLEEAQRDLAIARSLPVEKIFDSIQTGCVVVCENIRFFISLGLGNLEVPDEKVVFLSPAAPIARQLEGKKTGEYFNFRGSELKILDVF